MVRSLENDPQVDDGLTGHFTPESASKLLPLVRRIVREMAELADSMEMHRVQIEGLDKIGQTIEDDAYEDEVADIRKSFLLVEEQFESCRAELNALGVDAHDPFDGGVDFPAIKDRRQVSLCWFLDEDKVAHWHERSDNGAKRRKWESEMVSGSAV